jgi:hypothetical protein
MQHRRIRRLRAQLNFACVQSKSRAEWHSATRNSRQSGHREDKPKEAARAIQSAAIVASITRRVKGVAAAQ